MSVAENSDQDIQEDESNVEPPFPWGCCGVLLLIVIIAAIAVWFAPEIFAYFNDLGILPKTVSGWRIFGAVVGVLLGIVVGLAQGGTVVEIVVSIVICVILGLIISGAVANHYLPTE